MVAQRSEPGRGGEEKAPAKAESPGSPAAAKGAGSPMQAWLPLIAALVLMPVIAWAVTAFVLVPKMQKALKSTVGAAAAAPAEGGKEGGKEGAAGEATNASTSISSNGEVRPAVTLNKLLVNVAGTMGSRYLLTSVTLVGDGSDFSAQVAQHEPQLRDLASGILNAKTIADLEKPGARNMIRGELLAGFNSVMGKAAVREIYFTEFAIQ